MSESTRTLTRRGFARRCLSVLGLATLMGSFAATSSAEIGYPEKEDLKFGFIKLTDMAPLAIAYEKGYFEDEGLYVTLEAQANWKVLLDRVIDGQLDGAHVEFLSGVENPVLAADGTASGENADYREATFLRGRAALAFAASGRGPEKRLIADAERCARSLLRTGAAWAVPLAQLLRASVAMLLVALVSPSLMEQQAWAWWNGRPVMPATAGHQRRPRPRFSARAREAGGPIGRRRPPLPSPGRQRRAPQDPSGLPGRIVEGDIGNFDTVNDCMQGVDWVFHKAAVASVPKTVNDPIGSSAVNYQGTLHVLEAALNIMIDRRATRLSSLLSS